jgi:hypothetical protein
MTQPSLAISRSANHPVRSRVEPETLASEFRTRLLAFRSKSPRIQQLKKDLQQGRNRAPETICAILADAFNDAKPLSEVVSPAKVITDFFTAHVVGARRKLRDLMQVETVEEGHLNNVQMKIAQGDHSTPTLTEFKNECDEYRTVLDEIEAAVDAELYVPKAVQIMPRPSTGPLQIEVLSIRFLNLAPSDYAVEVATDGVRMRRKGTSRWIGPATWEQILSAAARTSVRETANEPVLEMGVRS